MTDPKWFHDNGLIKLQPEEPRPQENSIVFTVTHSFLYDRAIFDELVYSFVLPDGQIKGARSHDNMVAVMVYLLKHNFIDTVDRIKIFPKYMHPRDFIFIGYVQRRLWAYPLLPLLYLIFVYMAMTKYKVRPKWWDWNWIKAGFPERRKIFKTDTEILFWIRMHLPLRFKFIHWAAKSIVPLLIKKYGDDWVQKMMDTYYQHPEHPNRNYDEVMREQFKFRTSANRSKSER